MDEAIECRLRRGKKTKRKSAHRIGSSERSEVERGRRANSAQEAIARSLSNFSVGLPSLGDYEEGSL